MRLRWVVEKDGSRRLQYETGWNGFPVWEDVPEVDAEDEFTGVGYGKSDDD